MKTFALMIVSGAIYAVLGNVFSALVNDAYLNGDANLMLFLIGMGLGVFTARKFEWID